MRENFPQTKTVSVARMLVAVAVVLTALVGGADFELRPIVALAGAAAALSGIYLFWNLTGARPRLLLIVQCAVDVVFITLLAHYSGGLASPFKLLYFLPVIVAAGRLGSIGGMSTAAAAVMGHVVLSLIGPSSWEYLRETGAFAEIATLLLSLVLVAALEGFLARKAGESEARLETTRSELHTAQFQIANILDSMTSGLVLVDSDGKLVYLNHAGESILGVSEPDAGGRDYRLVLAEVPAFCERIAAALEAGRPEARAEFFVRRRGGGRVPVGLSTSILRDGRGDDRGVVAVFQDLTEARRIEERLRHDDRLAALGQFAAGVAHEIRNPLHAIKGSVDLLAETASPSGDEAKLLELVTRETDRLNRLLQDVLEYGRMESGEREVVDMGPLVEEVVAVARSHPSHRPGIEVETDIVGPVEATVDAGEMKRALLNLTINAFEAIDGDGRVRLTLLPGGSFASRGLDGGAGLGAAVIVEDTGCGIPAGQRDEVFQPFRTTKKGGTGLGLAIVDRIVRAHGGRVAVTSEPGGGSRFVIYLSA